MYNLSHRSRKRLQGVHPELALVFKEAITHSPIDFGIAPDGGVRTAERQNQLFNDPNVKTSADGYKRLSSHQIQDGSRYGHAVDIICYLDGKITWDEMHFAIAGGAILATASALKNAGVISIDLDWGATFGSLNYRGWDSGHFEIRMNSGR